jgi:hypothetical protein
MKHKIKLTCLFLLIAIPQLTLGQPIKDVSKSDSSYRAINKAVKYGYLPLLTGHTFQGSQAVTRKELAVIIDKLLKKVNQSNLSLTESEIQELANLSRTFKGTFTSSETSLGQVSNDISLILEEQKVLNADVSKTQEIIDELKRENEQQKLHMWVGIGIAAALGIMIN